MIALQQLITDTLLLARFEAEACGANVSVGDILCSWLPPDA